MTQSRTAVVQALKVLYPTGLDTSRYMHSHPTFGRMNRKKDLQGRHYHVPVIRNQHHGVSHDPTLAEQYESNIKYEAFEVTPPITNFARLTIEALLLRQCAESPQSAARFVNFFKTEMDSAMQRFTDRQAREAISDGGGALVQIAEVGSNFLRLKFRGHAHLVDVGMAFQGSNGDGTQSAHTLVNGGGVARCTSMDDEEGIMYFDDATLPLSNLTGLLADGWLFAAGDFKAAAKGLGAWFPKVKPAVGDMFYNIDRGARPAFYAGVRYDAVARGDTFDTVWQNVHHRLSRFGLQDLPIHIHPDDALRMQLTKENIKFTTEIGSAQNYRYGYEGFMGPNGKKFILDWDITPGEAWAVDFEKFSYITNGDQPKVDDYDGLELIRVNPYKYRVDFVVDYMFVGWDTSKAARIQLPKRVAQVG